MPTPALLLIYFFQQGASLPCVQGLWEWWPAYPAPKAKNTKYLLSLNTFALQLPAVASVYREISYWPCHPLSPPPPVHGIPWSPPASPFSSGTAQALNHPVPSGGISQAPSYGSRASRKGSLDLLAILVMEGFAPLHHANARIPTPPGPVLPPGLNALSFPPSPAQAWPDPADGRLARRDGGHLGAPGRGAVREEGRGRSPAAAP